MCTVSWLREDDGYQLFCNRDEKLTRGPALTVQPLRRDGVRLLAPLDADGGGTWIAANEFGLSMCLLNGRPGNMGRVSRGLLLLDLAMCRSIAEVNERIGKSDLARFAPFTIVALEPRSNAAIVKWDGRRRTLTFSGDRHGVVSSSSFDSVAVEAGRQEQFAQLTARARPLHAGHFLGFHRSHSPQGGPYSPCMHRTGAATVSFSWVTAATSEVSIYYAAGSPCRSLAGRSETLALRHEESTACPASC